MSYDRDFNQRRPSFLAYIAVGLISAIIGGLIMAMVIAGNDLVNENNALPPQIPIETPRNGEVSPKSYSPIINIAEEVGPAVVGISNRRSSSLFGENHPSFVQGTGSGVIFDSQGYIVTNNHVVEGASEILVTLANGKEIIGKIVGRDPRTDLAVVKIDPKEAGELKVAKFGYSAKLQVGELAVAIGNPLGLELARTVTAGIISALDRSVTVGEQRFTLIQTDAAINPGNSGGALVNEAGEVIGINSVKIIADRVEGLNFAIPIDSAKPIINDLIKHGRVMRPWLGIIFAGVTINDELQKEYDLLVNYGIVVNNVVKDGPAAAAGIKDNDIITNVAGQKIETFRDLQEAIEKAKVGDVVKVEVVRDNEKSTIDVILGTMPEQVNP